MTIMKVQRHILGLGLIASLAVTSASAAVSPEKAKMLGTTLTPIGAEVAGNAAGTIPKWEGGIKPGDYESGDPGRPANPFPEDKPLFTITAENLEQYKDNLTDGQLALFAKYPTYQMPVYQSRRTAAYPQEVYDAAARNAVNTNLTQGGNALENFELSVPFPIPATGVEAVWNHITRYRGGSAARNLSTLSVQRDGSFGVIKLKDRLVWPEYLKSGRSETKDDNVLFYYIQQITSPTRLAGSVTLVHETIDQVKEARRAWVYNSAQRRVRRAPNVSYDGPATGVDGLRVTDNYDMYNGAPDRYNWELKGKREIYIPYNSYDLMSTDLKYSDIIREGHLNPEHMRYELHRVWVVEATVKEGARHIYSKRILYIDEDSWGASLVEHFDGRGELWRVAEAQSVHFYDVGTPWLTSETLYDLLSGRYLVTGLGNEEDEYLDWNFKAKRKDFTAGALRRLGK